MTPWHKVIDPREDLRDGRIIDESQFAVHLDQVRRQEAAEVYNDPKLFFERTFLTQNLLLLAGEALRRLSGETSEASPVFNLATQFGGGKTHALTLLYHLVRSGSASHGWAGVQRILEKAQIQSVPKGEIAIFVGHQFDSIKGRGGDDGTPLRKSPWGEIAYQLGGDDAFAVVAEHDRTMVAPAGDVIKNIFPGDRPCLILMDEIMAYVGRNRRSTDAGTQFYSFLMALSEQASERRGIVLAVSIPRSDLELNPDDQADYQRFTHMLNRVGKGITISSNTETAEIIRRRLFDWDLENINQGGKIILPRQALATCNEYADWVQEYRSQIPDWFPVDSARDAFAATYPFHPSVISVFERKWQVLPQFQRTRGVLRLLARWVSQSFNEGYNKGHKDGLIGLGTAPLDDPLFRTATFEQLGEPRLEPVVIADICGRDDAHAVRRDAEAVDAIRKARLHRKVATTIFFESNGGQHQAFATLPEIRLAVGEPSLDIGNVETVLETLTDSCYYLQVTKNQYQFSAKPNLNKLLADRRASIRIDEIEERVRAEVQKVFNKGAKIDRRFFPEQSSDIPNRPVLTLVVLPPDRTYRDSATTTLIERFTREAGTAGRTYKSALLWSVTDSSEALNDEARKLLALKAIQADYDDEKLGSGQAGDLREGLLRAERNLTETVWRAYRYVFLLGEDNELQKIDLGMLHSSAASSITEYIAKDLQKNDQLLTQLSASFLERNWPADTAAWSTRALRDAFFASPRFPRVMDQTVISEAIRLAVNSGTLAYATRGSNGQYDTFRYNESIAPNEVELTDDAVILRRKDADAYRAELKQGAPPEPTPVGDPPAAAPQGDGAATADATNDTSNDRRPRAYRRMTWTGDVPPQKWMTFYNKIITRFSTGTGIRMRVTIEIEPPEGIPQHKVDETRTGLRELGMTDAIDTDGE